MDRRNERGKAPEKAGFPPPAFSGAAARPPGAAASGRRFTPEQRRALLESYTRSHEGMDAFCARHGLSTTTLCAWRRRYAAEGEAGLENRPPPRRTGRGRTGPGYTDEQRRQAVAAFHVAGMTRKAFAAVWQIDPKTITEWVRRYGDGGAAPAPARRGRPKGSGGKAALPEPVAEAVTRTKRRYPFFGLRRIRDHLARFLGLAVTPHEVRRTLATQGLSAPVPRRRRPSRRPPRRFERSRPGELWQSDITSFVLPRPRLRVYLTVFLDDMSRYVVGFGLKTEQRAELVTETLREALARYGKPREILTDQGRQYYAWRGTCDFQKLLRKEGIQHVVARSHHPQTVGKCERLWKTVKDEFFDRVRVEDVAEARARLSHWFAHYNFARPHQSLQGLCPADRFFAAEDPVRTAIEAGLARNERLLALGDKPRTPVYLAGRIGGRTVSLHGEGGRLRVRTEDGREETIDMASLGMPGKDGSDVLERSGGGASEAGSPPAAGEVRPAEPGGVGAGAVAVGDGGGADEGPRGGGGDPVVVAGGDAEGGGGDGAGGDAAAAVAAQPAGAVGDGGGIAQTAEEEKGGGNEPGEPGGEPGPAEEDDRHAHHGAAAGAGGGGPAAADAGVADGGGGDQERWIQAFLDALSECPGRPGNGWGAGSASRDAASGGPTSPEASA